MPTASLRDFCEALSIMTEMIVPQPDPTLLTTAQLTREISNARELIESKVSGAVLMLEGRIAANASALENVRIMVDRHVDTSIRDVKEILETRFIGMDRAINLLQDLAWASILPMKLSNATGVQLGWRVPRGKDPSSVLLCLFKHILFDNRNQLDIMDHSGVIITCQKDNSMGK